MVTWPAVSDHSTASADRRRHGRRRIRPSGVVTEGGAATKSTVGGDTSQSLPAVSRGTCYREQSPVQRVGYDRSALHHVLPRLDGPTTDSFWAQQYCRVFLECSGANMLKALSPKARFPLPELTARVNGTSWRVTGFHYPLKRTRVVETGLNCPFSRRAVFCP